MNLVASSSAEDRADLFLRTAERMNIAPALVEKDFWVCWVLGQIFDSPALRRVLMFKGGTALSKVFKLLRRFSEDIDLVVDYAPLGFVGDRDPMSEMSRNRRDKLLDEMVDTCREFVAGPVTEELRARFSHVLARQSEWKLALDANDPNTIVFTYPLSGIEGVGYVPPSVRLELGTHAELIPSGEYTVASFAAEQFPHSFQTPSTGVRAIKPERTFWEKATILHAEHHRPADKPFPQRYARHFYDMAVLSKSSVRGAAVRDLDLLRRVVDHKSKFYSSAWAKYDLAVPETLRLAPLPARVDELRRDFDSMAVMLFDPAPPLDEVIAELSGLQAEINSRG